MVQFSLTNLGRNKERGTDHDEWERPPWLTRKVRRGVQAHHIARCGQAPVGALVVQCLRDRLVLLHLLWRLDEYDCKATAQVPIDLGPSAGDSDPEAVLKGTRDVRGSGRTMRPGYRTASESRLCLGEALSPCPSELDFFGPRRAVGSAAGRRSSRQSSCRRLGTRAYLSSVGGPRLRAERRLTRGNGKGGTRRPSCRLSVGR